jgi:energy-converting hydrogenase B subunit C
MNNIIEIAQAVCLIVSAILIFIGAIGILRFNDNIDKIIYARIHILGIVDIAGVLAMIGLGQPLLAFVYFILAPIVAHAMANAYYYGEEDRNVSFIEEVLGKEESADLEKFGSDSNNDSNNDINEDNLKKDSLEKDSKSKMSGKLSDDVKLKEEKLIGSEDDQYTISKLNIVQEDKND